MSRSPLRERLYERLEPCPDADCDCLLWTGSPDRRGYGRITVSGQSRYVHRVIWEAEVGPIPDGLHIDHVEAHGCRHKNCGAVGHLEPVSTHENTLRGRATNPANWLRRWVAAGHRTYGEGLVYTVSGRGTFVSPPKDS